MSELVFFSGTMDCGKSTLALQMDHNRSARGRRGLVFTRNDRAGRGVLSSRLGLATAAVEADERTDLFEYIERALGNDPLIDYVICDEAQFLTAEQAEQLAEVVDELGLDVFAFGITTDFRTRLFPGSQRLIELADRIQVLQVETLCWCGARATHNARTVNGVMVLEGAQVAVGDVGPYDDGSGDEDGNGGAGAGTGGRAGGEDADGGRDGSPVADVLGYEVLCRKHHRARLSSAQSRTGSRSDHVAV
ncbi:MAG TPA: thymidine kinase [Actinocrinis sp.]|nr:thymidine kinase [Actinocrinis sp.]